MEKHGSRRRKIILNILFSLLVNVALPLVVYNYLHSRMSDVAALSIATAIPVLENVVTFLRHRNLDIFGIFMVVALGISLGLVLLGGSAKLLLIKESLVTGGLGLFVLISLMFPKPLLYYFAIHFTAGNDPEKKGRFASNWQYPYFRKVMYVMTIVWGAGMVTEALVRTYLVFQLTTMQFLAISNFVFYGFMGALILWTIYYRRQAMKRRNSTPPHTN